MFSDVTELTLSEAERRALTGAFEVERRIECTDIGATRAAFDSASVRGARVLTVMAHGVSATDAQADDGRTALVIVAGTPTDDGLLRCADIERMHLPPLVELLSCGGARGPARLGDDDAAQLIGACFVAGADCVIAARGDLPRASAVEMARILHERMRRDHDDPSSALRRARVAVAANPATSDPWFWCALSAWGAASIPVFAE
jgi:CHAT domain-containing protein